MFYICEPVFVSKYKTLRCLSLVCLSNKNNVYVYSCTYVVTHTLHVGQSNILIALPTRIKLWNVLLSVMLLKRIYIYIWILLVEEAKH